jgi:hypothetical protein
MPKNQKIENPRLEMKGRFVKIHQERGHGGKPFEVTAEKGSGHLHHLQLKNEDRENFWIYSAHTFEDFETKKLTIAARAGKIKNETR